MKKHFTLAALVVAQLASGNAFAHGEKPKHGGVLQAVSDLSFELVSKDGKATIYIEDHGKPVSTAGVVGKLTVLNGTNKSEVPLAPAGDNKLATTGEAKLGKGTKAIAALVLADKKAVNVRFSVK